MYRKKTAQSPFFDVNWRLGYTYIIIPILGFV